MLNIDEIYTVSNYLHLCNKIIYNNIPSCWIQGEISNISRPTSGHLYFSLKDNKACINCALFRLNRRNINFNLENGMKVLVRAAATLYEQRGSFQLIIESIESTGIGNLQLAFEQLKNKLQKAGLFDASHKKPLPAQINTIGVISSINGAVIKDIINILNKRYPFADILLFDCIVQGQDSAKKLAKAIDIADKSNNCDILILARGGGSLEDLWAFNEEILVRSIFNAKTPIISAIGHETDTTIVDFVSDIRAPTPSAAAVIATPDKLELIANTNKFYIRLCQISIQTLKFYKNKLNQLSLNAFFINKQINMLSQKLDDLSFYLNNQCKTIVNINNSKLNTVFEKLKQHSPTAHIQYKKEINTLISKRITRQIHQTVAKNKHVLYDLNKLLKKHTSIFIKLEKNKLAHQISALNHLSPLNTIARGYSITSTTNNKILFSISNIAVGEAIVTQLNDGKIYSNIYAKKNNS